MNEADFKYFNQPLFYGAGDTSRKNREELEKQIQALHEINSGFQQPCHCVAYPCKCDDQNAALCRLRVKLGRSVKIALDIYNEDMSVW